LTVVTPILDALLGSVGRFLEHVYLDNAGWLSFIVLAWMGVVAVGQRTVHSVRVALRKAIREYRDQFADLTPEELLPRLRPVYQAACAERRFMPSQRGLWITRCTTEKLRTHVGFTADGLREMMLAVMPPLTAPPGPPLKRSRAKTPRAGHKTGAH
jgi:hypothetical protein